VRVVIDRAGTNLVLIAMRAGAVEGELKLAQAVLPFTAAANEYLAFTDGRLESTGKPGLVPPTH